MTVELILDPIPVEQRENAAEALRSAFGPTGVTGLRPLPGGASGALLYLVEAAGRPYVMRVERHRSAAYNPHQYACMRIAVEAGIAPALRHLDAESGVVIMDFVSPRPLHAYAGGPAALARDLGLLISRLQATTPFPELRDFPLIVARLFGYVRSSGRFAAGLLDRHEEGFERIRAACPWHASALVSSHNDPNPRNIVFDGERLWLIDWETSYRNDPLVDVAILVDAFGKTRELEDAMLEGWLGPAAADRGLRARLLLIRLMTRLYYACLLLARPASGGAVVPEADLSAPSEAEFREAIASGRMTLTAPETLASLGKMILASFAAGLADPSFEEALVIAPHTG